MPRQDAPPEGLPDYIVPVKCLGEGGMGSVWSVCDKRTDREGALKAIRPGLLTEQAIVRRFEREMRTIAQLNHPYIVQILDVGRLNTGAPYMLMEQIDGIPLIDLDLTGRSLGSLIRLFDRILAALAFAHARRIIHRDLKPDNVLVFEDELGELIPKLMDFGLAMVAVKGQLATRLTADGMVVGTPAYMAPEQACDEHHKICPATDLYAFGCMLYEMLCGAPPHVAASPMALLLAHATKPPRPFVALRTIPSAERLEPLVMRLLEKDPENRFELAADVRLELRESGLLTADEDVDTDQIGSYGDTIFEMPRVVLSEEDEVEPSDGGDALEEREVLRSNDELAVPVLAKPSEAKAQVSVLNLREPPLVGRDAARNTLQRYVEDVRDAGQAAVCLVSGPTGIGKTRLVRWLSEDGETRGALRYLRVNVGAGRSASLSALLAIVNHLRLRGLSPKQCEKALLRFFCTSDPEDWRVAGFRSLVERKESGTSSSGSSMSSTLSRVDLLLYSALQRLADSRPLLLWLDDTHTVEPRSVTTMVSNIAARQKAQPAPILTIVIDRSDSDVPSDLELAMGNLDKAWLRSGVHLDLLDAQEMHEVTRVGLQLAPRLARHVVRLADGLPLLAVALARQWHAAGLLESTPDGYQASVELARLPVPEAVQGVLLSQLELAFRGMNRELWEPTARLAAVLGRTFTVGWLRTGLASLPSRVPPLDATGFLEHTMADGLVRMQEDGAYEYTSGLMREGLLATIPSERLADLHRSAAKAKASDTHTEPGLYIEIARHQLAGRAYNEAYESFVAAARDAIGHGRLIDARDHLDKAQEALAQQEGVTGPWDTRVARVWELELTIAAKEGEVETARERLGWLQHAADRLGDPIWRGRALRAEAITLSIGSDGGAPEKPAVERAHALLADAGVLLRNADVEEDEKRTRALASVLVAHIDLLADAPEDIADDVDPLELATEAVELARKAHDTPILARSLLALGEAELEDDDLRNARNHLTEALANATDCGELESEARTLRLLAEVAARLEDYEQAEKLLYSASRGYEALGRLDTVAECHSRLASLAREQGREGDARNHERWLDLISG